MSKSSMTTIYYDGKCHLCSREIDAYRRKDKENKLQLKDISSKDFDPISEGLNPDEVQRILHVKRKDGTLAKGVDAFIEIWRTLGILGWLAALAENQPTRMLFQGAYTIFAHIRPLLPKKECKIN